MSELKPARCGRCVSEVNPKSDWALIKSVDGQRSLAHPSEQRRDAAPIECSFRLERAQV
jgi:hypothetical protein